MPRLSCYLLSLISGFSHNNKLTPHVALSETINQYDVLLWQASSCHFCHYPSVLLLLLQTLIPVDFRETGQ